MSNNPSNYEVGLPRVSEIVEFFYPFVGESKDRFHSWLERNEIDLKDYMKEASEGGTYVHKAMEDYGNKGVWNGRKYKSIVNSGIKFHNDYNLKTIGSEVYVKSPHYQGTLDRLAKMGKDKWILDWKSYGLAKIKFGVNGPYRKPYDKLKKARLQLSLYNKALKFKYRLAVVELTEDGYYFHELEQIPEKELEEMILLFNNRHIDEI